MATPRHLVLGPGVFLREVDDHLVAEKPGMRVRVRDKRTIGILKRASSAIENAFDVGSAGNSDVHEAVDALVKAGLLEHAERLAPHARPDRTNDYLVSVRGRYEADLVEGVRRRLENANVVVVGDPWMGAQVIRALEDSGVGGLSMSEADALSAGEMTAPSHPSDLIVDLTWPAAATADGSDVAVLPAIWNGDDIVVGPVLGGRGGRCRVCCGPGAGRLGWIGAPRSDRAMGAGLVSAAVLSYLSGLRPCEIVTMSIRYDLRTRQTELVPPEGNISCARCGVHEPEAPHPTAQLAWSYEESVEVPMARAGRAQRWLSVRSQSVFRRRHFNMPPLRRIAEARGLEVPEHMLSLLDSTLEVDVAERQGKVQGVRYRRLPTVEGIGTSSLYVLPQEQHALIRGGAYYDPYEGELFPLSWPTSGGDELTTGFRLCITGNFTGAEVCFGRFGRRVVFQDAGFLVAQLLHGGSRLGLRPAISSEWSTGVVHSALDLAAGEGALAVIDFDVAGGDETVPDVEDGSDSWIGLAMDRIRWCAPSLVDDLVLYGWGADDELSEIRIENAKYAGRTPLRGELVHHDALRDSLVKGASGSSTFVLVGADLQAAVYRGGVAAYSSVMMRSAALAHYLSSVAGEMGIASRLLLKTPARLLEQSITGGRSRHRVLSALAVGWSGGSLPESSTVEVGL